MPKRKRNKSYYIKSVKKRKRGPQPLTEGVKGVLITSGDQGKFCVPEAYNLLNEYADQLYGPEAGASDHTPSGSDEEDEEGGGATSEDISRSLEEEVAKLKELKAENKQRFSAMDTGAKHVVFIKCSEEVNPNELVHAILADACKTKVKKSRYCQRIVPVATVCRANLMDICEKTEAMLKPYFHENYLDVHTYCVQFKSRNSDLLKREVVTRMVADLVTREDEYPHRVDFETPEYMVDVNVICNLCCLGVLKDYYKFRKYNLQTLTDPPANTVPSLKNTPENGKGSNPSGPPSIESTSVPTAGCSEAPQTTSIPNFSSHSEHHSSHSPSSKLPSPHLEQSSLDKDIFTDLPATFRYFSVEAANEFSSLPPSSAGAKDSVTNSERVSGNLSATNNASTEKSRELRSTESANNSEQDPEREIAGLKPEATSGVSSDMPSGEMVGEVSSVENIERSTSDITENCTLTESSGEGTDSTIYSEQNPEREMADPKPEVSSDVTSDFPSGERAGEFSSAEIVLKPTSDVADSHASTETTGEVTSIEITTKSGQDLERKLGLDPEPCASLDTTEDLPLDEVVGGVPSSDEVAGSVHQLEKEKETLKSTEIHTKETIERSSLDITSSDQQSEIENSDLQLDPPPSLT